MSAMCVQYIFQYMVYGMYGTRHERLFNFIIFLIFSLCFLIVYASIKNKHTFYDIQ